ncbi:MAG: hypothetical protein ACHQ03_07815 [Candidatus Bathyarchaeia archaeon]
MICGSTWIIDAYANLHQELGERFVKVRPKFDREKSRKKAVKNRTVLDKMRKELAQATKTFFDAIITDLKSEKLSDDLTCSESQTTEIGNLSEFVAKMRTPVGSFYRRESNPSEIIPESEFASRLAQQLEKVAACHAVLYSRKEIDGTDMRAVSEVALDTCLPSRLGVVRVLFLHQDAMNTSQIAQATLETPLILSRDKAKNSLEALANIGGIVIEEGEGKTWGDRSYKLHPDFEKIIEQVLGDKKIE